MATHKFSVAVVEDHPGYRLFLRRTIELFKDLELLIEASNGKDLLEKLESTNHLPDIILLDIYMPVFNGYMTINELQKKYPDAKVLVLSIEKGDWSVRYMLNKGARGYLQKIHIAELYKAIIAVCSQGYYYSALATEKMMNMAAQGKLDVFEINGNEMRIISGIAAGEETAVIAAGLHISKKKLQDSIDQLYKKMNVRSHAQMLDFAKNNSLVE